MALYTVPKFLEMEMKIAGSLTFKQFFLGVGVVLALIGAFVYLPRLLFILILVLLVVLLIAFNAIKVEGTRLYEVFFEGLVFLFMPKVIVWQKEKTAHQPLFQEITFELAKPKKILRFQKGSKLEKMKLYIQTQ